MFLAAPESSAQKELIPLVMPVEFMRRNLLLESWEHSTCAVPVHGFNDPIVCGPRRAF